MNDEHDVRIQLPNEVLKTIKKMAIDYNMSVSKVIEKIILEKVGGNTQVPTEPVQTSGEVQNQG